MTMIINLPMLRRRLEEDEELIQELFRILRQELPRMAKDIRDAVAAADPDHLSMAAHALKGSSSNLAAERVNDLAAELEMMGRNGDLTRVATVHQQLEAEIVLLQNALVEHAVAA